MMKISDSTVAEVSYSMFVNDKNGELIEFFNEANPKKLIFGNNILIPGFETHMSGLESNSSFEFTLKPEEAFGNYNNELVIDVPKSAFEVNGKIKEDLLYLGNEVSMIDNVGNPILGTIIEIATQDVKMDFNHKLADKHLFIKGKVHDVRHATNDDLSPKEGCGCDSGCGCGSDSDEQLYSDSSTNSKNKDNYEEDCPTCGNPAETRSTGNGNCGCS